MTLRRSARSGRRRRAAKLVRAAPLCGCARAGGRRQRRRRTRRTSRGVGSRGLPRSRPSWMRIDALGVARPRSASCVTRMMVMPSSALSSLEHAQDLLRWSRESRLPVGSSARSSGGLVDQGAGDGHALLLAAGQLRRLVVQPVAQADALEQRPRARDGLRARSSCAVGVGRAASSRSRARWCAAAG